MIACGGGMSDTVIFMLIGALGLGVIALLTVIFITAESLLKGQESKSMRKILISHSLNINICLVFMFIFHELILVSGLLLLPLIVSICQIHAVLNRNRSPKLLS
jgi:hypothetical protein